MDTVFWMDLHAGSGNSLEKKFRRLLEKVEIGSLIGKDELTALKVHVGERGNLAYINPNYARITSEEVKFLGGKPFLTDTNTLYSGGRHNGVDHCETAGMHGYCAPTTGAPFVPADGLRGLDYTEADFKKGVRVKSARIANGIYQADKLIVLSHFKGHKEAGFGGTIKNIGMGCAAVPGKLEQHSSSKPAMSAARCVGCAQCFRRCPVHAITMVDSKAIVNTAMCIGCGQCVAACNYGAMNVRWDEGGEIFMEKMAEYAVVVHERFTGKVIYVNFAFQISPDCDCWDFNDVPIARDVGIFASRNPLALDRATLDMVNKSGIVENGSSAGKIKSGKNVFDTFHGGDTNSEHIFGYCRRFGMTDAYTLEKI